MMRALLVCPGRGSYTARTLGHLARYGAVCPELLEAADRLRLDRGEEAVSVLDSAATFDEALMMQGSNAAALTFLSSVVDLHRLDRSRVAIEAVIGNSMGWYTSLYAAGALSFEQSLELALTMGGLQHQGSGSQVLYPLVDGDWRLDAGRVATVEQAVARSGARWSIRLGGFAVLAGTDQQIAELMGPDGLPEVDGVGTSFPLHLHHHAAYHTPLMARVSELGSSSLADLSWSAPSAALVDGRGMVWRPRFADPRALRDYTLGHQVTQLYDFTSSLRVALKTYAPDRLILLGPGQSLGSPVAQVLIAEGWQGIRTRKDFKQRQNSDEPLVIALDRPEQARHVLQPNSDAA